MTLPGEIRRQVEAALEDEGAAPPFRYAPVGGGCINNGARVEDEAEGRWFLKWNPEAPDGLFASEAEGLHALAAAAAGTGVQVPTPLAGVEAKSRWFLMTWLQPGPASGWQDVLGRGLATLHSRDPGRADFGWHADNWIGSLPQWNAPCASWGVFWRDHRLAPQLASARTRGHLLDAPELDDLMQRVADALDSAEAVPTLLHGDLWSGNAYGCVEGPALVDPAVFRGHAEVDLAMSELFGGFSDGFYRAYEELRPLPRDYHRWRRDVYQLYYLLVHVNLFGDAYAGGTRAAARRALAALSS